MPITNETYERYIINSRSLGVFLGLICGRGIWSQRNPGAIYIAPTFDDMEEAMTEIGTWEFLAQLPSDITYIPVKAIKVKTLGIVATMQSCVDAGATPWGKIL